MTTLSDGLTDMTATAAPPSPEPHSLEDPPPARQGPSTVGSLTVLPSRDGTPPPSPRPIATISDTDLFVTVGALVSALCTTLLLFGRLTPLSGKAGFVVVFAAVFVALYAALVFLGDTKVAVVDRVMGALMVCAALFAITLLSSVVFFVFFKGWRALFRLNTFTEDMGSAGPAEPLDVGGIKHAIVGTLIIISIAIVLTVPISIACAVYLNESGGRLTELVRSVVTAMTALPSIVAGLFIFATYILILGQQRSGLAAALGISLMMLPIMVRSADVVLRLVPGNLREAAAALGAPQWRVVWHVVLPTARSGLATSVILGVARGIGETAPVLLASGAPAALNLDPTENQMNSLPLATFEFVKSGVPNLVARGFAAASVLMVVVLLLFSIARIIGGRAPGQLSSSQRRRAADRSQRDLARFVERDTRATLVPVPVPEAT